MKLFSNDLINMDLEREVGECINPTECILLNTLLEISKGRKQYGKVLSKLAKVSGSKEISNLYNKIDLAGNVWSSIHGILVKSYYCGNTNKIIDRVSKKIIEVAQEEETWYVSNMRFKFNYPKHQLSDNINVCYEDGYVERIRIAFTRWLMEKTVFEKR